jgi:hypothetical protein
MNNIEEALDLLEDDIRLSAIVVSDDPVRVAVVMVAELFLRDSEYMRQLCNSFHEPGHEDEFQTADKILNKMEALTNA